MTKRLEPSTPIPGLDGTTVGDFWAWAYSDVLGNTERGKLAEFLVGHALEIVDGTAVSTGWLDHDLFYQGHKLEVKASGYLQNWYQSAPSRISFGIAERYGWIPETNSYTPERVRASEAYVFCVHAETKRERANPLNVAAWEFYVVPTSRIDAELGPQKSVGLERVRSLAGRAVGYPELRAEIDRVLGLATRS